MLIRAAPAAIALAVTALHLGYRWSSSGSYFKTVDLARAPVGTVVRNVMVEQEQEGAWRATRLLSRDDCQVVIVFDPSCPYCRRAARRERTASPSQHLPAVWVAPEDSLGAWRYKDYVASTSRVTRSDSVWKMLGVQGVPAAFLVDRSGRVRRVWTYQGEETREELEAQCSASP